MFPLETSAKEFEYLEPAESMGLTTEIVEILKKEKCRIPKWEYEFGGVTVGEFAAKNQKDIAVICYKNGNSKIRIFWGGPKKCPSEINSIGQYITTVGKDYIVELYEAYGGPKPPKITHDAIEDYYVEKASIVIYCHKGKWINLTGAD